MDRTLVDRRWFLRGAGLSLGGGLVSACAVSAAPRTPPATPVRPRPLDASWESLHDQFHLTPNGGVVYLGGFFLASHPASVREAIEGHRKALDDNPFVYVEDNVGRLERAARGAVADYLGVDSDELAMTDSTTMGLGLVYGGLKLRADQEVVTSVHDHPSTAWSLRYRAQREPGAQVRTTTLYERGETVTQDAIVRAVVQAIRPQTRVVAMTWVHSTTGVKMPISAIADALATINRTRGEADRILLFVDGVHGFGVEDFTIASLRCDVFVASCHKWLFGPRGTGFVWANAGAWAALVPTIPTFETMWRPGQRDTLPMGAQFTPGGFHSFEHRWALPAAFELHGALGKARVAARIHALNRQCKEGLAAMKHVRLHTPMADELSAGIVSFDVDGLAPADVVRRLRAQNIIASESPYAFKCVRVSPGLLNTESDIDTFLRAVRTLT